MANTYDFNINVGCSFLVYLSVTNNDGSIINLSGFSSRGYVKNQYADIGFLYNLNPQISSQISGILMISGTSQSTQSLIAGEYTYDIEIYNSGNYALQVLNGDFNVHPSTFFNN